MKDCVKWTLLSGEESKLHLRDVFALHRTNCGKNIPRNNFILVGLADANKYERRLVCGNCFDL